MPRVYTYTKHVCVSVDKKYICINKVLTRNLYKPLDARAFHDIISIVTRCNDAVSEAHPASNKLFAYAGVLVSSSCSVQSKRCGTIIMIAFTKFGVLSTVLILIKNCSSSMDDFVLDVNDILNEKWMPGSLFMLEGNVDYGTRKRDANLTMSTKDGTFNTAFSTMGFHRYIIIFLSKGNRRMRS